MLICDVLSGNQSSPPPIWLMRQAGRYLPEYREVRETTKTFLDFCYTPKKASKVTLQPITRFGFDAAIIFSDILIIPDAMGQHVEFIKGKGPQLKRLESLDEVNQLTTETNEHLAPVYEAVSMTREALDDDKALIGFAGSPWTVASYMLEGSSSKDFATAKGVMIGQPKMFETLMEKLVEATTRHLRQKIASGANVVKLFDSWAGVLDEHQFADWVIAPTKQIIANLKADYPDVPVMCFPRGAGHLYESFVEQVKPDAVTLDTTVPLARAKELQSKTCVQGNLDPIILASSKSETIKRTREIVDTLRDGPQIFNLGHGIVPHTPIENVIAMVETVRNG